MSSFLTIDLLPTSATGSPLNSATHSAANSPLHSTISSINHLEARTIKITNKGAKCGICEEDLSGETVLWESEISSLAHRTCYADIAPADRLLWARIKPLLDDALSAQAQHMAAIAVIRAQINEPIYSYYQRSNLTALCQLFASQGSQTEERPSSVFEINQTPADPTCCAIL